MQGKEKGWGGGRDKFAIVCSLYREEKVNSDERDCHVMCQGVRSDCLQLQQRVEQLERQNRHLQLLVQQTFSSLTYSTLQVGPPVLQLIMYTATEMSCLLVT